MECLAIKNRVTSIIAELENDVNRIKELETECVNICNIPIYASKVRPLTLDMIESNNKRELLALKIPKLEEELDCIYTKYDKYFQDNNIYRDDPYESNGTLEFLIVILGFLKENILSIFDIK